jgi:hypothetical protein
VAASASASKCLSLADVCDSQNVTYVTTCAAQTQAPKIVRNFAFSLSKLLDEVDHQLHENSDEKKHSFSR